MTQNSSHQSNCSSRTPNAPTYNENYSTATETEDIMAEFRRLTKETKQLTNQLARFLLQPLGWDSTLRSQPTSITTASSLLRDIATALERMNNVTPTPPMKTSTHVLNMDQVLVNIQDKLTNISDDLIGISQTTATTDTAIKQMSRQLQQVIQQKDTAKESMSQMQRQLTNLEQNMDQLVRRAPGDRHNLRVVTARIAPLLKITITLSNKPSLVVDCMSPSL